MNEEIFLAYSSYMNMWNYKFKFLYKIIIITNVFVLKY